VSGKSAPDLVRESLQIQLLPLGQTRCAGSVQREQALLLVNLSMFCIDCVASMKFGFAALLKKD